MTEKSALVLFAHGARDPDWARPIERVRDTVRTQAPGLRVAVAYLEFMSPDLATTLADLVDQGVTKITVVPVFIAQGGHLKKELPLMLDQARARHAGVAFELAPPVGESAAVVDAMATQARRSAGV